MAENWLWFWSKSLEKDFFFSPMFRALCFESKNKNKFLSFAIKKEKHARKFKISISIRMANYYREMIGNSNQCESYFLKITYVLSLSFKFSADKSSISIIW